MSFSRRIVNCCLSLLLIAATLPVSRPVLAQDLIASEDLTGGSSAFVFRVSRKQPQAKLAGGRVAIGNSRKRASKYNSLIASSARKRRAASAASREQIARAAASRKIRLSNTLTAKADGFLDKDQTDLAITNYRAALIQDPKNTRASGGLSNALTAKGIEAAGENNDLAAVPFFTEAAKLDNKNDVAFAKLGSIFDANGDRDKAIANYEKAVAINPEYATLYAPLGLAYVDAGEVAKAENCLQKATTASIDDVDVRFLRGLVNFKQNNNAEALSALDRALEMDGRFVEAQYYRGQVLDRMGKSDQAIASYQKAIELEPAFTPASFDLGVAFYNKGDYNNAAAAYQETVKYDNANYQAHANLASTYRQLEKFPDANAEYKTASVGIKNADLYSEWGFCLGKTEEWEKAVARLETAKDMSPSAIDNSNLGWGYYNAAYTQKVAKNDAGAAKNLTLAKLYLETAVKQDPKLDAAYLNLGATHNALGEFQLAVDVLRTLVGFRRDWVIATNQLGIGFRGLGDLANAVATFKRVVDLDGNNVRGLFNLGEAYNASGNKKEAKKINDKLRKIDPSMAAKLDGIFSGKVVVDAATQKIQQKVPKVPRFPF